MTKASDKGALYHRHFIDAELIRIDHTRRRYAAARMMLGALNEPHRGSDVEFEAMCVISPHHRAGLAYPVADRPQCAIRARQTRKNEAHGVEL